jgi:hypothetical protein
MNKLKKFGLGLAAAMAFQPAFAAVNAETVQKMVKGGTTTTIVNSGLLSTDSYTFQNDGRTFLHFKKTGAGAATVTFTAQATVQGLSVSNQTVTVPATTGDVYAGPFPTSLFNDSSANVTFSLSDTVGLSFELMRL